MIRFLFEETDPMRREETPSSAYFRFDHEAIQRGPDNQVVARHLPSGLWETTDNRHLRGNCVGKAQICFEDANGDASRCFGPYDRVRFVDGAIYAGNKVVALFLDDSRRWVSTVDHTEWPAVVVKAV